MHKIYMRFAQDGAAWRVSFLEGDLKTQVRADLFFADSSKIVDTAERGGALKTLADKQAVATGISMGRGGIFLHLTEAQYRKLK